MKKALGSSETSVNKEPQGVTSQKTSFFVIFLLLLTFFKFVLGLEGTNSFSEMSGYEFNASLCHPCLIDFTGLEQHLNYARDNIISLQLSYTRTGMLVGYKLGKFCAVSRLNAY
jgi:hypothetical protein